MLSGLIYSFLSTFYYKEVNFSESYFDVFNSSHVFRHTANTPISTLLCNLEFLKTKMEDKNYKEFKEILDSCYLASLRLKKLVNNQGQSQKKEIKKEKIYVKKSLENIKIIMKQNRIGLDINLNSYITENFYLNGSSVLFEEMLICLINNACEAYQKGQGKVIDILIKKEKSKDKSNKYLTIYVTDYASGMDYLEQKLATLPKYTHKKNNSGIGLFFVKNTVEKYFDGELHIFSQKGFGTQVCLKIAFKNKY